MYRKKFMEIENFSISWSMRKTFNVIPWFSNICQRVWKVEEENIWGNISRNHSFRNTFNTRRENACWSDKFQFFSHYLRKYILGDSNVKTKLQKNFLWERSWVNSINFFLKRHKTFSDSPLTHRTFLFYISLKFAHNLRSFELFFFYGHVRKKWASPRYKYRVKYAWWCQNDFDGP